MLEVMKLEVWKLEVRKLEVKSEMKVEMLKLEVWKSEVRSPSRASILFTSTSVINYKISHHFL